MRPRGAENGASDTAADDLKRQGAYLMLGDRFDRAYPMFRNGELSFLPVVEYANDGETLVLVGSLFYVDVLRAYNRALVDMHREEHT